MSGCGRSRTTLPCIVSGHLEDLGISCHEDKFALGKCEYHFGVQHKINLSACLALQSPVVIMADCILYEAGGVYVWGRGEERRYKPQGERRSGWFECWQYLSSPCVSERPMSFCRTDGGLRGPTDFAGLSHISPFGLGHRGALGRVGYFPLSMESGSALVSVFVMSMSQGSQDRKRDLTDHLLLVTDTFPHPSF